METVESVLSDSRLNRCKKHNLESIVLIVIYATLKRVYGYHNISEFAKQNADILENYIDLTHGCPSTVTLWRNFERLNISKLIEYIDLKKDLLQDLSHIRVHDEIDQSTFNQNEAYGNSNLEIIRSHIDENYYNILNHHDTHQNHHSKRNTLHCIIEKLASKNSIMAVASNYNSPTIAKLIIKNEGDYLLEINSTHHSFYEQLRDQLDRNIQALGSEKEWHVLKNGPEFKMRRIFCLEAQIQWLDDIDRWPKAKCMIAVEEKNCNGKDISCSTNYYLCSRKDIAYEQVHKLSEYHFIKPFAWLISFETDCISKTQVTSQKVLKSNLKWIQCKNIRINT